MRDLEILQQMLDEMPYRVHQHLIPYITEALNLSRTEGIKEGFEAGRLPIVEGGRNCGDLFQTVEDYLNSKNQAS